MAEFAESPLPPCAAKADLPAAKSPPRAVPLSVARELVVVVALVAVADLTIYRGTGFAGLALALVAIPALVLIGTSRPQLRGAFWLLGGMLLVLAARLVWLGSPLAAGVGAVLLIAFSLALRGHRPYVANVVLGTLQLTAAGLVGLEYYRRIFTGLGPRLSRMLVLQVVLPVGAIVMFGTLFVLANPDVAKSVAEHLERSFHRLVQWSTDCWLELLFWMAAGYLAIGLLRPLLPRPQPATQYVADVLEAEISERTEPAPLLVPLQNMLLGVIGLFALYLVFEFQTLWFREFPPGFHYSGYAHQGAAWLTVALALATLVLSLVFRGPVLRDPRIGRVRLLAWIWSAENLLLALAVYHRMSIYIDFNGMTRMRTIGLFGISTVVAGFVLVLWKIHYRRDFLWLIQRQLWALAIAIYLYVLTPVDWLVHSYNVRQILSGDVAPCVQISVHPKSAEGYLVLLPLTDCQDPIIRDGVRALLAEQELAAERRAVERRSLGWTAFQLGDHLLVERLRRARGDWQMYASDDTERRAALERFHKYAYQWY